MNRTSSITKLLVVVFACLGFCTLGVGCQDEVGLGNVLPVVNLSQDWDADGTFAALPDDPGEGDYLLDFGRIVVKQRATRYISIGNAASAKADLSWKEDGIRFGEGTSPDFFLDKPPLAVLAPGQSTTFAVHYIPLEEASDMGSVVVETNDPDHSQLTISLAGEGVSPDIQVCLIDASGGAESCNDSVAPGNLGADFGMNDLGHSSTQKFLVRNLGVFTLTVAAGAGQAGVDFGSGTNLGGEFALDPVPWTGTLEPGAEKTFTITYTPYDGGADQSRIEVTSDDPDEPQVIIDLLGNGLAPKICPQPPFIVDFGSVSVGTSSQKAYRFTSCGNQILTITGLDLDSGVHGFFSFSTSVATPFDLSPGEAFDVGLTYAPTSIGAHSGKLTIHSNDPNAGEGWVDLLGKATPIPTCDINVVPTDVNFGTVSTSGFSNQTVTIQNTGDADCEISEIRGPTGSPEFSFPSAPGITSVPVGEIRQFSVQYRPTDEGTDSGSLTIVSDDPDEGEVVVTLNGAGVQPPPCDFQADPALLNFGTVPMGQDAVLSTRIWNFGSEECTLWGWDMVQGSDPSFTPGAPPFPRPDVAPGAYYEIQVTLNPQSPGTLAGTLEVRGGPDPLHQQKVYVALSGGGDAARMCLNPTTLDFGPVAVGNFMDMSFDITACGSGHLKIRQIVLDGANPDFTFAAVPGAPLTIQAGGTRTIHMRYSPSEPGADFGRVIISSNDDQLPTGAVELVGNYTGTCPSVFDCQPQALTFPSTEIGQSSYMAFVCTNHGSQPLTVVDVSLGAGSSTDFRVSAPGIPLTVQPNGELQVEVGYIPADVGTDSGNVTISSEFTAAGCDNFTLITVPLDAEGLTPDLPECIEPRVFQPTLKFGWPNGNISNPTFVQVFMTPVVINLTDDNGDGLINEEDVPDIIFNAYDTWGNMTIPAAKSMVRAVSGDDGHEIWTADDPRFRTNNETQIAAADIDGDNLPEILASKYVVADSGDMNGRFVTGNILCFEHDGTFKWESEAWHAPEDDIEDGSSIGVADLDRDGHPEIFRCSSVFDHRGNLLWEGEAGRGGVGHGCFSVAADLDGQGGMELIAGNTAYHADGTVMWQANKPDGLVGIADFDLDGKPEVLLFASGFGGGLYILDGLTGSVKAQLSDGEVNAILPPVIADIDGAAGPEIGVVGTCSDQGEDTECFWGVDVNESNLSMNVIWKEILNDSTLGGGNTAFDFEGDGPFEVLQNDETYVNIYAGLAHNQIYQAERWSVTGWELPIVVDVDNDNHAEIVVIQNGFLGTDKGILVYGNVDNDWVATRRVWNQFDYHITNIRENGTVPRFEVPNWTVYNNFLANEPFCQ
ncbi:MAG TPA: choice-of-anchor D domain-containing protein [Myxococcota bacterium]|nr:choice-of-anchor D domain-containing protein [Myxococcota bacterium]